MFFSDVLRLPIKNMICQKCRQKNAAILYKELHGETRYAIPLCEACAEEFEAVGEFDCRGDNDFTGSLLFGSSEKTASDTEKGQRRCPVCSATFADILLSGEAGCSVCFRVFAEELTSGICHIHGQTQHCGRIPLRQSDRIAKEKQLSAWKDEIQKAVEAEEFELAASLRDKIRCLQNEIGNTVSLPKRLNPSVSKNDVPQPSSADSAQSSIGTVPSTDAARSAAGTAPSADTTPSTNSARSAADVSRPTVDSARSAADRFLSIADGINDTLSVDTALVNIYTDAVSLVKDIDSGILDGIVTKGA